MLHSVKLRANKGVSKAVLNTELGHLCRHTFFNRPGMRDISIGRRFEKGKITLSLLAKIRSNRNKDVVISDTELPIYIDRTKHNSEVMKSLFKFYNSVVNTTKTYVTIEFNLLHDYIAPNDKHGMVEYRSDLFEHICVKVNGAEFHFINQDIIIKHIKIGYEKDYNIEQLCFGLMGALDQRYIFKGYYKDLYRIHYLLAFEQIARDLNVKDKYQKVLLGMIRSALKNYKMYGRSTANTVYKIKHDIFGLNNIKLIKWILWLSTNSPTDYVVSMGTTKPDYVMAWEVIRTIRIAIAINRVLIEPEYGYNRVKQNLLKDIAYGEKLLKKLKKDDDNLDYLLALKRTISKGRLPAIK